MSMILFFLNLTVENPPRNTFVANNRQNSFMAYNRQDRFVVYNRQEDGGRNRNNGLVILCTKSF